MNTCESFFDNINIKTNNPEEKIVLNELMRPSKIDGITFASILSESKSNHNVIYMYDNYDGQTATVESIKWKTNENLCWHYEIPIFDVVYNPADRKLFFEYLFVKEKNSGSRGVFNNRHILSRLSDYHDDDFMIDLFDSYNGCQEEFVNYDKLLMDHPVFNLYDSNCYRICVIINEYILHRKLNRREIMDILLSNSGNYYNCNNDDEYIFIMQYVNDAIENMIQNNYTEKELSILINFVTNIHLSFIPSTHCLQLGFDFLQKVTITVTVTITNDKEMITNIILLAIILRDTYSLNIYKKYIKWSDIIVSELCDVMEFDDPYFEFLFEENILSITVDDFIIFCSKDIYLDYVCDHSHIQYVILLLDMIKKYCLISDINQVIFVDRYEHIKNIVSNQIKIIINCFKHLEYKIDILTLKILCPDIFSSYYPALVQFYRFCIADKNPDICEEIETNVYSQVIDNYKIIKSFFKLGKINSALFDVAYNNVCQSEHYVKIFKSTFASIILEIVTFKHYDFIKCSDFAMVRELNENILLLIKLVTDCFPSNQVHLINYYWSYILNIDIDNISIENDYIIHQNKKIIPVSEFYFIPVLSLICTNDFIKKSYIIDTYKFSDTIYKILIEITAGDKHLFFAKVINKIMCDSTINKDIMINNKIFGSVFATNIDIAKQIKRIYIQNK
jgi:hypothetical protein